MGEGMAVALREIGRVAIPVRELERAVGFYRDVLGMRFLFQVRSMAFFSDVDGNALALMSEVPRAFGEGQRA